MFGEIAENYFYSMSPLAERIGNDIRDVKTAYENLWGELSINEKDQIINDTIIYPHILVKYSLTVDDTKRGCFFSCGRKMVIDEQSGTSWRDEHSAPFSWKSPSLLKLCTSSRCISDNSSIQFTPNQLKTQDSQESNDTWALGAECDGVHSSNNATVRGMFSHFCAKIKFLPGKLSGLPVTPSFDEKGYLSKIKFNAVSKFNNTLKLLGGDANETHGGEEDVLITCNRAVVNLQEQSEAVSHLPPPKLNSSEHLPEAYSQTLLNPDLPMSNNDSDPNFLEKKACINGGEKSSAEAAVVLKSGFDFLDDW